MSMRDYLYIRVLILWPAKSKDAPLKCCIKQFRMRNNEPPWIQYPYVALSYVWGDATHKRELYCLDDDYCWRVLYITQNLYHALREMRGDYLCYPFWIDAACIDQNNVMEKEQQIAAMCKIFEAADHTLVWLGASDHHLRPIFGHRRFISLLAKKATEHKRIGSARLQIARRRLDDRLGISAARRHLEAQKWFERAWTYQEMLFSSRLKIRLGSRIVSYSTLTGDKERPSVDDFNRAEFRGDLYNFLQPPRHALELITAHAHGDMLLLCEAVVFLLATNVKNRKATFAKDQVMCTIAVLQQLGAEVPQMTYEMDVPQLFAAATRAWLSLPSSLGILNLAATGHTTPHLPSWCVDWGRDNAADYEEICLRYSQAGKGPEWIGATGGSRYQSRLKANGGNAHTSLEVRGCSVDQISWYTEPIATRLLHNRTRTMATPHTVQASDGNGFQHDSASRHSGPEEQGTAPTGDLDKVEECLNLLQELATTVKAEADLVVVATQLVELLRGMGGWSLPTTDLAFEALLFATFNANAIADVRPHERAAWLRAMRMQFLFTENERSYNRFVFTLAMSQRINFHTLFRTKNGQLGACYCTTPTQQGDSVMLVEGARYPLVLRKVQDGNIPRFIFLGPAYITGMMESELWPENLDELEDLLMV